jgi:hypothetical protein
MDKIASSATHGEVCWDWHEAGNLAVRSLILFGSYRVCEVLSITWHPADPYRVEIWLRDADDGTRMHLYFGITEGVRHILSTRELSPLELTVKKH